MFDNIDKNNTGIIKDKGINGGVIYNIGKKGQEMLETAYGIQSIVKEYYESIIS